MTTATSSPQAISLLEFNSRIKRLLNHSSVAGCWVMAETSDVQVRRGHCYLELLQKDPNTGIDSRKLLREVKRLLDEQGYQLGNCDITICAERPKLNPHIPAMQEQLASCLECDLAQVSIKATTTEQLGFTGREEGISAHAVALLTTNAQ